MGAPNRTRQRSLTNRLYYDFIHIHVIYSILYMLLEIYVLKEYNYTIDIIPYGTGLEASRNNTFRVTVLVAAEVKTEVLYMCGSNLF